MRERWEHLKVAFWEFVSPPASDEEPDTTLPEVIARWVGDHRHLPTKGGDMT